MHLLWVYEFICYISIYIYYRTFCYLLFLPSPIYHFRILLALSKTHCCIWFSNIYFDLKSIKRVKSTRHETDFTDKYNLSLWLPWTFYIMFIAGECLFVNCFTTCNNCFFFVSFFVVSFLKCWHNLFAFVFAWKWTGNSSSIWWNK